MTQLSPHFSLEEFTHSQTAARLGINNTPTDDVMENLKYTAECMEKVRTLLNSNAIRVSSAYRSLALNAAVGSKTTSQHVTGQAVDFTCPTFGTPEKIVAYLLKTDLEFDQIIVEFGSWVHISFSDQNRKQALVIDSTGTRAFA